MQNIIDPTRLNLTSAQVRDFSLLLPYMQSGNWCSSITLAKAMYSTNRHWKKDIAVISQKLSYLYKRADIFERKEVGKIYFHGQHRSHKVTWAYRIKPNLIGIHEVDMQELYKQFNLQTSMIERKIETAQYLLQL